MYAKHLSPHRSELILHAYYVPLWCGRPKAVDPGRRLLASMALVVPWPLSAVIDNVSLMIGTFQHGVRHVLDMKRSTYSVNSTTHRVFWTLAHPEAQFS